MKVMVQIEMVRNNGDWTKFKAPIETFRQTVKNAEANGWWVKNWKVL